MNLNPSAQFQFYMEMADHQMNTHEFFSPTLLESVQRNFGIKNCLILYYDTHGKFLSSATIDGREIDHPDHPYHKIIKGDVVRYLIYQEAVRDRLNYYNLTPRLYRSTDIISELEYDNSTYVRYIEEQFHAHYSLTFAFGINAYIQLSIFHTKEEGDFLDEDWPIYELIYQYIANAYRTFKKYEQRLIISNIQGRIIVSGEKAYLVTDNFRHVMACSDKAEKYLESLLGYSIADQIGDMDHEASWLSFLLWENNEADDDIVITRILNNQIFKIHTHKQEYSNGIIDRYHWITISSKENSEETLYGNENVTLTRAEQKVAELMYNGLTYKQIAEQLVVSYHTVKKHVQNIYTKCGVKSRYQLAKWIENVDKK